MTATMRLYEISDARNILDTWLEESEGEMTPELEALLGDLTGQMTEKIERVALYVRERLAHAKAVKDERDRLDAIVKREEKAAESLKSYLKLQMERLGTARVNGLLATVAIQNNSVPSVACALDNEALKIAYLTNSPIGQFVVEVPAVYRIAHSAVVAAQKAGDPLPAEIEVSLGSHLRIR